MRSLLFAAAFGAAVSGEAGAGVLNGVPVPMRDGVRLAADVYLPDAPGRFPVILELTPYGRGPEAINFSNERDYWRRHGYAFVIADVRGQGDSQGEFGWFGADINDGHDLVEWIAAQPWSDGKVGMRGSSYSGTNQWYAAKTRPPHLACITPSATVGRPLEELPYKGGAFALGWAMGWVPPRYARIPAVQAPNADPDAWLNHRPLITTDLVAAGKALPIYREFLRHPTLDAFWRPVQFTSKDFEQLSVPSLAFTGWFDGTLPGTLWFHRQMQLHSKNAARQYLVIGPWEHLNAPDGGLNYETGEPIRQIGDFRFPDQAFLPGLEITRRFYDWCLKGGPSFEQAPVLAFLTGSNRWLELPSYPAPQTSVRSLYFHSQGRANTLSGDGILGWDRPGREPADHFKYDPRHPLPSKIGSVQLQSTPVDLAPLERRPDVLVYTSPPLKAPLSVLGDIYVELTAASSAKDTDFTANILDVAPDGKAVKLGPQNGGQLRARYRKGFDREVLLTPGRPDRFRIDIFGVGHTFLPGHRIRIDVSSSSFPWISANPNTGNPIATDTAEPMTARQTVFHDSRRVSRVLLPVIPESLGAPHRPQHAVYDVTPAPLKGPPTNANNGHME